MAFDDEQLRAEVHAEFEGRDVFDVESLFGSETSFIVKDYASRTQSTKEEVAANNKARKARIKADPASLLIHKDKQRTYRREVRRAARKSNPRSECRCIASVVMSDGSVWNNPEYMQ